MSLMDSMPEIERMERYRKALDEALKHGQTLEQYLADHGIYCATVPLEEIYKHEIQAQSMPIWIAIEERFPADGQTVVVHQDFGNHQDQCVVTWDREIKKYHVMNCITHWMPLPPPPVHG